MDSNVLVTLVGIQTAVLLAGIPWAFVVQGQLAGMTAKLEVFSAVVTQTFDTERRVGGLEKEIEHLKDQLKQQQS